jgi:hypothetical protein
MTSQTRKPRADDLNLLAKSIVDRATGEAAPEPPKNPAAVELGRIGGKARASKLSSKKRAAGAQKAARARWKDR